MSERWKEIRNQINEVNQVLKNLQLELIKIQEKCKHENLPKHLLGEEYMETCSDCGRIFYLYRI